MADTSLGGHKKPGATHLLPRSFTRSRVPPKQPENTQRPSRPVGSVLPSPQKLPPVFYGLSGDGADEFDDKGLTLPGAAKSCDFGADRYWTPTGASPTGDWDLF